MPLLIGIFLLLRVLAYLLGADMRDISYWSIIGRIDQFLLGMLAGFYYRHRFKQGKELDRLAVAAEAEGPLDRVATGLGRSHESAGFER